MRGAKYQCANFIEGFGELNNGGRFSLTQQVYLFNVTEDSNLIKQLRAHYPSDRLASLKPRSDTRYSFSSDLDTDDAKAEADKLWQDFITSNEKIMVTRRGSREREILTIRDLFNRKLWIGADADKIGMVWSIWMDKFRGDFERDIRDLLRLRKGGRNHGDPAKKRRASSEEPHKESRRRLSRPKCGEELRPGAESEECDDSEPDIEGGFIVAEQPTNTSGRGSNRESAMESANDNHHASENAHRKFNHTAGITPAVTEPQPSIMPTFSAHHGDMDLRILEDEERIAEDEQRIQNDKKRREEEFERIDEYDLRITDDTGRLTRQGQRINDITNHITNAQKRISEARRRIVGAQEAV